MTAAQKNVLFSYARSFGVAAGAYIIAYLEIGDNTFASLFTWEHLDAIAKVGFVAMFAPVLRYANKNDKSFGK